MVGVSPVVAEREFDCVFSGTTVGGRDSQDRDVVFNYLKRSVRFDHYGEER